MSVTHKELSDLMEFGRLIYTLNGEAVALDEGVVNIATPEEIQYVDLDADGGAPDPIAPDGWEYLTGFTGQYSYNGNTMHPSEFIGGRLADHILSNPGYYVAVEIDALDWSIEGTTDIHAEPIGWGILHYIGS